MQFDPLHHLLHNHYYAPAAMLSRLLVNIATLMWGVVVVVREDTLSHGPYAIVYMNLVQIAPEDVWGWFAIITSTIGIVRIVIGSKPHWIGAVGYMLMWAFWLFVAWNLLFVFPDSLPPSGAAGIFVIALLAFYAAISGSRKNANGAAESD